MKRTIGILFLFLTGIVFNGFSQGAAPADFFAGKWEINLTGTPRGDVKFLTDLVRKDGKLTGELADAADASAPKRPITDITETADTIVITFASSQGDDIRLELRKVDTDNLKGQLMDMFPATAKRVK